MRRRAVEVAAAVDLDLRDRDGGAVAASGTRCWSLVCVARELDQRDALARAVVVRCPAASASCSALAAARSPRLERAASVGAQCRAARQPVEICGLRPCPPCGARGAARADASAAASRGPSTLITRRRERRRQVDRARRRPVAGAVGQAVVVERHAEGALGLGGGAREGHRQHPVARRRGSRARACRPPPGRARTGSAGRGRSSPAARARAGRSTAPPARASSAGCAGLQDERHVHGGARGRRAPDERRVRHRRQHRAVQRGRRRLQRPRASSAAVGAGAAEASTATAAARTISFTNGRTWSSNHRRAKPGG